MADLTDSLDRAARAIAAADCLVIGAGAGMGVDSGLPDFRGPQGFWRAYPPYQALGLDFTDLANPHWFLRDPSIAWGFYGHRLNLYRSTVPHPGFARLKKWAARMRWGAFVYTSNVDGQFQRAGFDPKRIVECHGAIDWLQCVDQCGIGLFPADDNEIQIEPETMRAQLPFPACPGCGGLARPNILLFGDGDWAGDRTRQQEQAFRDWQSALDPSGLVVVECGAGTSIPSVRNACERLAKTYDGTLIRINPRESSVDRKRQIGLPLGAAEAIGAIDRAIDSQPTGNDAI
jgi:NAD-dependent SIR2 family protein deacetylase